MTPVAEVPDWVAVLQGVGVGVSIAALVLLPIGAPTTTPTPQPFPVVGQYIQPASSEVDGNEGLRPVYVRTRQGLALPEMKAAADDPTPTENEVSAALANALREETGLPVDTLAGMIGVTRVTYHKWLKGTGMHPDHLARLNELSDTIRTLRSILGGRLQAFLDSSTPSGRPVDILEAGDFDLAIGYALRPDTLVAPSPVKASTQLAGLPDWTRPVQPIGWNVQRLTSRELNVAVNQLSPAPTFPDAESILAHAEDSDDAYVAFGIILE